MQGVYIHIPFCRQACSYCDFHFSTLLKNKSDLIDALIAEIDLRKNYLEAPSLDSIYFGGGTPSLLDKEELDRILSALSKHFSWKPDAEITIECNPDDLSQEKLKELRSAGFNRLSVGLQSFNDEELKWMNRAHDAQQSEGSIKAAQDAGFGNISIDLMYGSKFQDERSWEGTLQKAIALGVQHISAYNLTAEPKTAFGTAVKKGLEPAVDDEKSARQFLMMIEMLEKNGFIHYEISNFGKKDRFALHNSNYWKGRYYLGLGPSAHSFNGKERQWNVSNNSSYIKALTQRLPFFEIETLSNDNRYNEYVLTGLRTIWGCDVIYIEKTFGAEAAAHFKKIIGEYMPLQVSQNENSYALTREGRLLADKIAMELFI